MLLIPENLENYYNALGTDGKESRELIDAITAEDIREMAYRIFAKDNLSRLIYI